MTRRKLKILIAGGGTGGHLFPGIAIAQTFMAKEPDARILFAGTNKAFEKSVLSKAGFDHQVITAKGLKGGNLLKTIVSLSVLPKGILESISLIRRFSPDIVVGVGGYVAGPVILSAWILRKPIVLHEQNMLPGVTNRLLAPLATRMYLTFGQSVQYLRISPRKILVSGNPVRKEILHPSSEMSAMDNRRLTILILGGSQGAHAINTAVVEALAHLKDKARYRFIHQTGEHDEKWVAEAYLNHEVFAEVRPFFFDMRRVYQQTDVMVCRAGATTVSEITALGKPAIFIPFPYAADDHQTQNAKMLEKANAAELIPQSSLNGSILARKLEWFLNEPEKLDSMARNAKAMGNPNAGEIIVEDCLSLLQRK